MLWPHIFWGGGEGVSPLSFWSGIIKFSQIPTMWQSFRAIGRGSSENEWRNKKKKELDGQGKARREAARRRNSECKINFNSRNASRSNGSRPTAVKRAVIGRRRGALVANRQRRSVRIRLNMSVINNGGGAHWRSAHFLLFVGRALCPDRKVLA